MYINSFWILWSVSHEKLTCIFHLSMHTIIHFSILSRVSLYILLENSPPLTKPYPIKNELFQNVLLLHVVWIQHNLHCCSTLLIFYTLNLRGTWKFMLNTQKFSNVCHWPTEIVIFSLIFLVAGTFSIILLPLHTSAVFRNSYNTQLFIIPRIYFSSLQVSV